MEWLTDLWWVVFAAGGVLGTLLAVGMFFASRYEKVGPNEVLIVSGRKGVYVIPETGKRIEKNFKIYHGGGTFVFPVREKVNKMSVELMTLEIRTPEFFTKVGVPIVVDGIAQIKVLSDDPVSTLTAAEMFLSKTPREMNEIAHQMMQGHLRAVISTMPFEEIHANPEAFAQAVQKLTAMDLANMGIQVVSFTIREIKDPTGYLTAIGRPKMAEVQKFAVLGEAGAKRDAEKGQAAAEREAAVAGSQARELSERAKINAELAIKTSEMDKEKELDARRAEVSDIKARSDMAYDLQKTKMRQLLVEEELGVSKIERQRQIELEEYEIDRREKELTHSVKKPAEAEQYRIETLARAEQDKLQKMAAGEAEAARSRGLAEADVIRARGEAEAEAIKSKALAEAEGLKAKYLAEAEGMREKAEAYKNYNSAAVAQMLIEKLPEVAAAVSAPLSQVDRIVMIDGGNGNGGGVSQLTRGVTEVIAQVPGVLEAMTGIDLGQLVKSAPGLSDGGMEKDEVVAKPKAPAPVAKPPVLNPEVVGESGVK